MPHILLVEDELPLRRVLTLNLARRGYAVAEADSVEAAFDMVVVAREVSLPFDLIILETHLPDRCGWDLLRLLRPERTPVILISPLPVTAGRLAEFAPVAALLKPFPIEALLRLVARAEQHAQATA
jgi:two-component system KDP operon response regulator KdpE